MSRYITVVHPTDRWGCSRWRIREPRDADEGDELEAELVQADHAFGAESVGTTVEEELVGETLDQHLAEERPDRPGVDDAALSVVDEGPSDDEEELVGDAVIDRDEFALTRGGGVVCTRQRAERNGPRGSPSSRRGLSVHPDQ